MPRDFESLYRAQAQAKTTTVKGETLSLPPGYLVGYDVRLRQDYTVVITAGAANIGGRLVNIKEDHQLVDADWVAPKINSARHYYIYLSKAGAWFVDIVAPVWNNEFLYYEQPDTNWRAVGKIFLADGQIIFGIKEVEKNEQTVTVAPAGFTGKADYYCTGENDQILINAAIRYLHEAYDGGECNLLRGTYSLNMNDHIYPIVGGTVTCGIFMGYSNITLSGDGISTVLYMNTQSTTNYIILGSIGIGMADIVDAKIRNLNIYGDLNAMGIGLNHLKSIVENCKVQRCYMGISLASDSIISNNIITDCRVGISASNKIMISGNTITSPDITSYLISQGINGSGSNVIINGNRIYDLQTSTGDAIGINITGDYANITDNSIYDITADGAADYSQGINYGGNYGVISGNTIYTLANATDAANVAGIETAGNRTIVDSNYITGSARYGIKVTSGSTPKVHGNLCYNNGSDATIPNTNGHNFYDAGTDTQVYSNSWQQPVAGEPTQGELKWLPQATSVSAWSVLTSVTTTAVWASMSFGGLVPVGAKSAYCTVRVNASSSAAGDFYHFVSFSSDTTATPSIGTSHVQVGVLGTAAGSGERVQIRAPTTIPLNASLKSFYYSPASERSNASACQISVIAKGYTV